MIFTTESLLRAGVPNAGSKHTTVRPLSSAYKKGRIISAFPLSHKPLLTIGGKPCQLVHEGAGMIAVTHGMVYLQGTGKNVSRPSEKYFPFVIIGSKCSLLSRFKLKFVKLTHGIDETENVLGGMSGLAQRPLLSPKRSASRRY